MAEFHKFKPETIFEKSYVELGKQHRVYLRIECDYPIEVLNAPQQVAAFLERQGKTFCLGAVLCAEGWAHKLNKLKKGG